MTTRKPARPAKDSNVLHVQRQSTETFAEALASIALRPTVQASLTHQGVGQEHW